MPAYWLGIDLGTTVTAAAIGRPGDHGLQFQVVPLSDQSHAMPSVLFLPGDGSVVVGEDAQRRALADPGRAVREFRSRVGDEVPLLAGDSAYYAHDLAAGFVSWLCQNVAQREGERPEAVALTCPANWGPDRTALFEQAVRDAGVPNVTVLTEPEAAAISYASRKHLAPGAALAVYDLGGARFDVAVFRADAPARFSVLGRSEGIEGVGGLSFDEMIFQYVCAVAGVPLDELDLDDQDIAAEVAQLRRECTAAKEELSASTHALIPVTLGPVHLWVRLTRAEFEEMIRPDLDRTIEAMHQAFASAGVVAAGLDAIVLTGGSSRIPLVGQLIAVEFGRVAAEDADPKAAVAMGAARFAAPAPAPVRDPAGPLVAGGAGEHATGGLVASLRHQPRRAMLAAAALVVLVVGAGLTALGTPVLSGLITSHGTVSGAAAGTASGAGTAPGSAPGVSGSPVPSAQSSAKAAGPARTAAKNGISGSGPAPSGVSFPAAPADSASGPVTGTGKTGHPSPPAAPPTGSHPVPPPTPPPATVAPTPPPTTVAPTPPPATATPSTAPPGPPPAVGV
jgi:actin-like ATPase involved in cell morphogenesis